MLKITAMDDILFFLTVLLTENREQIFVCTQQNRLTITDGSVLRNEQRRLLHFLAKIFFPRKQGMFKTERFLAFDNLL
jgi:hypothetical protein